MRISQRIAINTSALFLTRVLTSLLSLVVAVLLARHLGKAVYGDYNFVFAYLALFQSLTGIGIDTIVVKEISRDPSKQNSFVSNALFLKLLFSLLATLAAIVVAHFLGYSKDMKLLIGIASVTLLFGFGSLYTAVFQSQLKAGYYAIPELVINIIFSLMMLLSISLNASLVAFVFLQSVMVVPVTITCILFARKIMNLESTLRYDPGVCRSLLAQSWPIFISSVFVSVYMRIDQVMLFKMVGSEAVGLYSASVKLAESLGVIPIVFMTSIYPLLCQSFASSRDSFSNLYKRSFKYMSIVIVPIAFGTTLLSDRIISFFYGVGFLEASSSLVILIWAEVFVFLGVVCSNVITAAGIQRYMALFTIFGAVSNVILNIILIPRYDILGASLATLLSYGGFGLILQYAIRETRLFTIAYIVSLGRPILCAIPMAMFAYVARNANLFFVIPISSLIYVIMLLLSKTIDKEDITYIKSIFQPATETS